MVCSNCRDCMLCNLAWSKVVVYALKAGVKKLASILLRPLPKKKHARSVNRKISWVNTSLIKKSSECMCEEIAWLAGQLIQQVMMLWNSIDSSLCVCCDIAHATIWKQRWTENMSGGRRIAVAVDPSEHSEKAFDCEFSSWTEFTCPTIFYNTGSQINYPSIMLAV